MSESLVHSLVDRIYAATSAPERWQEFVEDFSDALGGAAVFLALQTPGFNVPIQSYRVHLRPMPADVLEKACADGLPRVDGATRTAAAGFRPMSELLFIEEFAHGEFAAEWLDSQCLIAETSIIFDFAFESGEPTAVLVILERRGCRPLGPADRELCDLLAPHLTSAYSLQARVGGGQHQHSALAEVMNRLPIGLVLLDRELRPVITNRGAERALSLGDGFSLGPDGLHAANPRDDAVLQGLLSERVAGRLSAEHGNTVMAVSRPSGKRSFPVMVGALERAAAGDVAEDAAVSVIFGVPESGQGITLEALSRAYDLTPAESDLVRLLADGYCLKEAAELRGVSLNTVRTQLKHVFAKTDTNRQGKLIRLVLTGAASFSRDGD
jgi:DNA-binding CsgD family transcriptional regulator